MKLCLLSDVMLCLYQVTEFVRFNSPCESDNNWSSSTIPNALSRILVNIASHVRQNAETSAKVRLSPLYNTEVSWLSSLSRIHL